MLKIEYWEIKTPDTVSPLLKHSIILTYSISLWTQHGKEVSP